VAAKADIAEIPAEATSELAIAGAAIGIATATTTARTFLTPPPCSVG
jgi:hypothetical protein